MKRFVALLAILTFLVVSASQAQTPTLRLKFDGDLTDSSGAGIITQITPTPLVTNDVNTGFAYTTDRFGVANKALAFPTNGAASILLQSALAGDSNQSLGLKTSASSNTTQSFTLSAWIYVNSVSQQSYNTVFGNLGSGAGTLHAGLDFNSGFTHLGFEGNNVNGATTALVAGQWYHVAYVYESTSASPLLSSSQRIYINGVPEVVRTGVTNTLKAADLILGNYGAATDVNNDFRGRLDDVAVYNTALKPDQILALAAGVDPGSLPTAGTYSAPASTYGYRGKAGMWGVRELKLYPGYTYSNLVDVDRIMKAQSTVAGGSVADYWAPVINFQDDESASGSQYFTNKGAFALNTAQDDNSFLLFARATVRIPTAGNYTFGFRGDDGGRLRIVGKQFVGSTRVSGSNIANPAHGGDSLFFPASTGDSATLGVVNLAAGDYALEYTFFENSGGCSTEVFAAPGAKSSVDGTFQLVGNTAAGGLEIVRDANTIPTFTVNGGSSVFVQNGNPANVTLAWSVGDPSTVLSINQGIGTVAATGTMTLAAPTTTTTYTMTATVGADTVTTSVVVLVNSAPIVSMTANKLTVASGAPVILSWSTAGASSLVLNPGNIDVTGTTSRTVNPTANTTYILSASNAAGTNTASVSVAVGTAPVITSFTTSDANPVYGKNTLLNWTITNSDNQSIDQGVGSVAASGSVNVVPLLTTNYTLTAGNAYGTTTAVRTITLATPLGVSSAAVVQTIGNQTLSTTAFTARRVSATTAFPFATSLAAGKGYLDSAVRLLKYPGGENAGTATVTTGYTTINFTDGGADGDYTTGNNAFPGGGGDNFAVEITGSLVVNTPGEYTFVVNCDDGCWLRIDGQDVIVDDANHTPSQVTGKVTLTKPTAQFDLIYYDSTGSGEVEVSWQRPNLTLQQLSTVTKAPAIVRNGVIISEFCASNSASLLDEDQDSSDWIEIWNSTTAAVNLSGYYLSTSATNPTQWALPSKVLAANEYLVVFASGKNRIVPTANLHTNFTLVANGGYLSLKKDNGAGGFTTLTEFNPYPDQSKDVTYGSSDQEGYLGYMEVPTPGTPNAVTYTGFLKPVAFSQPRGRMSASFPLTLTPGTPGATIRYTTDGSEPTTSTGTVYTGPITIAATTVLRATNYLDGWKQPLVKTNSYLFIDDIVNQTSTYAVNRGWPAGTVNGQVYRYGLNTANVTAGGGTVATLKTALGAVPSVSLSLKPSDFFDATTGIYSNPSGHGRQWERSASLEIINADGTTTTQNNCGVRVRGGASRDPGNPKHGFHLYFRSQYGEGTLNFPLFGTEGKLNFFDQIDMRCEQNNSWSKDNSSANSLVREEWARKSQGDMGQPYSRNSYFHLYINGIYWGVYDWEEKSEADFAATNFGGSDTDYDTVKSAGSTGSYNTEVTDGNFIAWQKLYDLGVALKYATTETARTSFYYQMRGLNPNGTRNTSYPILLDPANLADYLLVSFYDGSFDSPMSTFLSNASNNWFAFRKRDSSAGGFKFFCHDQEHGMGTAAQSYNRVGPWGDPNATGNNWGQTWNTGNYRTRETFTKFNPQYLHEFLCYSSEYRQLFNDRVHLHMLGTGALTLAKASARVTSLQAQVDPIIHAEAARWGSTSLHKGTWLSAISGVNSFVSTGGSVPGGETDLGTAATTEFSTKNRTTVLIEQLKGYTDNGAKALYIAVANPLFSGQAGGLVNTGYSFQISNPVSGANLQLYYTIDGSDPRALGGGVGATATLGTSPVTITLTTSTTVRARIYNTTTLAWSGDTTQLYVVGVPASASNIVFSKLNYNPPTGSSEFIELMNISTSTVVMTGCSITKGVTYSFPNNYTINPGDRCLIVGDAVDAFMAANPMIPAAQIAGQYSGKLDNSGERVLLVDAAATPATIKDFTYDIVAPWPVVGAVSGPCLVLIRPETNPDHTLGANWRASVSTTGNPGAQDGTRFASWMTSNGITSGNGQGDKDGDGLTDFLEYALGIDPSVANLSGVTTGTVNVGGVDYLSLTITHPLGRDDVVTFKAEASTVLGTWETAVLVSTTPIANGTSETLVFRHTHPKTADVRQFMRLNVSK